MVNLCVSVRQLGILLLAAVLIRGVPCLADSWSGETRFGIGLEPAMLRPDTPVVAVLSYKEFFLVESAALVTSDADRIFEVSLDYDHYKDFAPYVTDSRYMVRGAPWADSFIWTRMAYPAELLGIDFTLDTSYYLRVQSLTSIVTQGDLAIRWVLESPHPGWNFPVRSSFSVLDGSWYILPMDAGACSRKSISSRKVRFRNAGSCSYVSYFVKIRPDTLVPDGIVRRVLRKSLEKNVRSLILEIGKRARETPY